jgi:hypothetical protein
MGQPGFQESLSRIGGLGHALELTLGAYAVVRGKEARASVEALRNEAVNNFRNSDIPPDREMEHAQIAGPAIDAIETIFNGFLAKLDD